jgi:hypothetical protein
MLNKGLSCGLITYDGTPYVKTCRGTVRFETLEQAANFAAARVLARLTAYKADWDSFDTDVEASGGQREEPLPF